MYRIKIIFSLFIGLSPSYFGYAQAPAVREPGNIKSVDVQNQVINIQTDKATVRVSVYSPSIIRIRMDKQSLVPDFSYAVVAKPLATKTEISQSDEQITLSTDSIIVKINKRPFAITFYTLDGKVINEDEKGLTTSWSGDEVNTYKHMQDGERFIGLGEKTGALDRRGSGYTNWNTDAYNYQDGTDPLYSTIPFYTGIHHGLNYGIFLDNTFQTDFNFGASNNRFASFGAQIGQISNFFLEDLKKMAF